jgi:hypothetical protein
VSRFIYYAGCNVIVLSVVAPFEVGNKYIWKFYQQSYQSLSYNDKLDTKDTEINENRVKLGK